MKQTSWVVYNAGHQPPSFARRPFQSESKLEDDDAAQGTFAPPLHAATGPAPGAPERGGGGGGASRGGAAAPGAPHCSENQPGRDSSSPGGPLSATRPPSITSTRSQRAATLHPASHPPSKSRPDAGAAAIKHGPPWPQEPGGPPCSEGCQAPRTAAVGTARSSRKGAWSKGPLVNI